MTISLSTPGDYAAWYDYNNNNWDVLDTIEVSDLTDVSISSLSDNDVVRYNSATGKWENHILGETTTTTTSTTSTTTTSTTTTTITATSTTSTSTTSTSTTSTTETTTSSTTTTSITGSTTTTAPPFVFTIDKTYVDSTLTDFPVGISVESSDGLLTDRNSTDWQKLRATVSGSDCYIEVERWDITNDEAALWVKVPSVSSSADTDINFSFTDDHPFDEDFTGTNGSSLDSDKWCTPVVTAGTGTSTISSNRLKSSITHSSGANLFTTMEGLLVGDFEIEFTINDITMTGSARFQGGIYISNTESDNSEYWAFVGHRYETGNRAHFRYDDDGSNNSSAYTSITESQAKTQYRLKRVDDDISAYYWTGSAWSQIGSTMQWVTNDCYFGFLCYIDPLIGTPSEDYYFDDLTINSLDEMSGSWPYVGKVTSTPAQNVWDDDFVAVYHMAQDPSGSTDSIKDSTSNENHGTPSNFESADLKDDIGFGYSIYFDGSNESISVDDDNTLDVTTAYSAEAFFSIGYNQRGGLISKLESSGNYYGYVMIYDDTEIATVVDNTVKVFNKGASGTAAWETLSGQLSTSTWYHVAMTPDKIFLDGSANVSSRTNDSDPAANAVDLLIGQDYDGNFFNGTISEVRISKVTRSDAWIKATNHVLKSTLLK